MEHGMDMVQGPNEGVGGKGKKKRGGHKFDIMPMADGKRFQVIDVTDDEPVGYMHRTREDAEDYMSEMMAQSELDEMYPGHKEMI